MHVHLSNRAIVDIGQMWDRIAELSADSATRLSDAIIDAAFTLAEFPERHPLVPGFERPIRQLTVGSWAVLYETVQSPPHVQVLRVVPASADIPNVELPELE